MWLPENAENDTIVVRVINEWGVELTAYPKFEEAYKAYLNLDFLKKYNVKPSKEEILSQINTEEGYSISADMFERRGSGFYSILIVEKGTCPVCKKRNKLLDVYDVRVRSMDGHSCYGSEKYRVCTDCWGKHNYEYWWLMPNGRIRRL